MNQQPILEGYAADANELVLRFEALRTEIVLAPVLDFLPPRPGKTLDVGAGTGRDAAWLTERGYQVLAVEPVGEFRQAGRTLHRGSNMEWLNDSLPLLMRAKARAEVFDLILCVAVWQHLPADQHELAIASLSCLAAPGARVILSIRHGPGAPNRPCFATDTDGLIAAAKVHGFNLRGRRQAGSVQARNQRAGVTWDWLCFDRCSG